MGFSFRNDHTGRKPLYWNFPDLMDIEAELKKIDDVSLKVAYVHWGVEYIDHPSWQQQLLGRWMIDVGFDLVVGMHPHVLQGYEVYRGKHIFYSLGNFVFNMPYRPTHYGAIVGLDEKSGKVLTEYVSIGNDFCPRIVSEKEIPESYRFLALNVKIPNRDNAETYMEEARIGLKAFQRANRLNFLKNICRYDGSVLAGMLSDFVNRKISKTKRNDTSNINDWGE